MRTDKLFLAATLAFSSAAFAQSNEGYWSSPTGAGRSAARMKTPLQVPVSGDRRSRIAPTAV